MKEDVDDGLGCARGMSWALAIELAAIAALMLVGALL